MKLRLKDIIDLEYLIRLDDEFDTIEETRVCQIRDRDIYTRINDTSLDRRSLLLRWLAHRKVQFSGNREKKGVTFLPGTLFFTLYHAMIYIMVVAGLVLGLSIVTSFLAYHGARPVNVSLFITVFILLPLVLTVLSAFFGVRKLFGRKAATNAASFSGVHSFLSSLMFKGLPQFLQKLDWDVFKKSLETIEYTALIIKIKKQQYQELFFWPFFNLTSLFSISFSTGALLGTLFRVMVSDMAFGWQSTILTSSGTVHMIVSKLAWPWAGLIPLSMAYPGLEQIEGSRIVLKDGISVLATQDLVSWWPFLCLGLFFYAVLPRGIMILTGLLVQRRALDGFDFNGQAFNDLIARMQAPLLSVETQENPVSQAVEENPIKHMGKIPEYLDDPNNQGQTAGVLLSREAYAPDAENVVLQGIEASMFYAVKQCLDITFNFDEDEIAIKKIDPDDIDQVILVQEVWQPPIRGLLFYIKQLQAALPNKVPVLVLLTNDAGQQELTVAEDDIDFDIWKKAVFKLANPNIHVKRFIHHDS